MNPVPHREQFSDPVREAMGILDRVSEGQNVLRVDIEWALRLTGDVGWRHEMHTPVYPMEHA